MVVFSHKAILLQAEVQQLCAEPRLGGQQGEVALCIRDDGGFTGVGYTGFGKSCLAEKCFIEPDIWSFLKVA